MPIDVSDCESRRQTTVSASYNFIINFKNRVNGWWNDMKHVEFFKTKSNDGLSSFELYNENVLQFSPFLLFFSKPPLRLNQLPSPGAQTNYIFSTMDLWNIKIIDENHVSRFVSMFQINENLNSGELWMINHDCINKCTGRRPLLPSRWFALALVDMLGDFLQSNYLSDWKFTDWRFKKW